MSIRFLFFIITLMPKKMELEQIEEDSITPQKLDKIMWSIARYISRSFMSVESGQNIKFIIETHWFTLNGARALIKAGEFYFLGESLDYFNGLDHQVALDLIEAGMQAYVAWFIEHYWGKFEDSDELDLAIRLIDAGEADRINKWIRKLDCDHNKIASKMIEVWEWNRVLFNIQDYKLLNIETLNSLKSLTDSEIEIIWWNRDLLERTINWYIENNSV